jgi:hypothetical protein
MLDAAADAEQLGPGEMIKRAAGHHRPAVGTKKKRPRGRASPRPVRPIAKPAVSN